MGRLAWGVAGAAFASALSTATVACLFILVIFRKKSPVQISLRHRYSFDKACLLTTWRLGLPVALERATSRALRTVVVYRSLYPAELRAHIHFAQCLV